MRFDNRTPEEEVKLKPIGRPLNSLQDGTSGSGAPGLDLTDCDAHGQ